MFVFTEWFVYLGLASFTYCCPRSWTSRG